jgi:polar amino acid transport system substrate-binding protein
MTALSGFRNATTLALTLATACAGAPAWSACSRPFNVPVSAIGMSVTVSGLNVGGVYPELLRSLDGKNGCTFNFSPVPRARLEAMFETARADILVPATRTPRRDQLGYFVPVIVSRATLISIDAKRAPVHTMQQLRDRKTLRLALVRGYDYGQAYQALAKELTAQGRVVLETDAVSVARLINVGLADATIMAPTILAGAIEGDARVGSMLPRLRIEPIDELPWGESGIYISRTSVGSEDRAELERLITAAVKSGAAWDIYKRYYTPDVLNMSSRPH